MTKEQEVATKLNYKGRLEIHILQNFVACNLNRDDTGRPKTCTFGGRQRGRISSQSLNRHTRQAYRRYEFLSDDEMATRTKLIYQEVGEGIFEAKKGEISHEDATRVALAAIEGVLKSSNKKKAGSDEDDDEDGPKTGSKSQYLIFIPQRNIADLTKVLLANWNEVHASIASEPPASEPKTTKGEKPKKNGSGKGRGDFAPSRKLLEEVRKVFNDTSSTPELALFGRMIADMPAWEVTGACNTSHAFTTNAIDEVEFDYFTAVDDLQPASDRGAAHLENTLFLSGCFYRQSVIDVGLLASNLGKATDRDYLRKCVSDYIHALYFTIPSGKQHGFSASNTPNYVLAVYRPRGISMNLGNAFEVPVRVKGERPDRGIIEQSIYNLEQHLQVVSRMAGRLGTENVRAISCAGPVIPKVQATSGTNEPPSPIEIVRTASIDALTEAVTALVG